MKKITDIYIVSKRILVHFFRKRTKRSSVRQVLDVEEGRGKCPEKQKLSRALSMVPVGFLDSDYPTSYNWCEAGRWFYADRWTRAVSN